MTWITTFAHDAFRGSCDYAPDAARCGAAREDDDGALESDP
jgi:hypothetical protein